MCLKLFGYVIACCRTFQSVTMKSRHDAQCCVCACTILCSRVPVLVRKVSRILCPEQCSKTTGSLIEWRVVSLVTADLACFFLPCSRLTLQLGGKGIVSSHQRIEDFEDTQSISIIYPVYAAWEYASMPQHTSTCLNHPAKSQAAWLPSPWQSA